MSRIRRHWTAKEDTLLRDLVNNELENSRPLLWRELAKHIPGRSNKDCRKRWWNSLAGGTNKGPWSQQEDKRLIEAVWEHGTNWNLVARAVGSRYADQCSSHWSQVLDPDINYCDWTTQEDDQLLHAVLSHGTNWSTIAASHTPHRTTLALKNRYSTLRLRHQNSSGSRDSLSGKTARESSSPLLSKGKTKKSLRDQRAGNADAEGDEGDEEEDEGAYEEGDEDGDEDEDDEEEQGDLEMIGQGRSTRSPSASKPAIIPQEPSSMNAVAHVNPNMAKTHWTGYHGAVPNEVQSNYGMPKTSAEQWLDGLMDQTTMYVSTNAHLYPSDEDLHQANMSFAENGEDAMNLDFSNFQGALYAEPEETNNQNPQLIPGGNATPPPAVTAFSCQDMNAMTPESFKDTNSPVRDTVLGLGIPDSALHHVSINLACTTHQLSQITTFLASTGPGVSIKIDTQ